MATLLEQIEAVLAPETERRAAPSVHAVADAARRHWGGGVVAVLFYGSCLRSGEDEGKLVDLYLLAEGYGQVHRWFLPRLLNRLVPPNVYYVETVFEGRTVRAKYALVSLEQLSRLVGPETDNPYFWARFAQPTGILWARDPAVAATVRRALAQAVASMAAAARPLLGAAPTARDLWVEALAQTYATELRSEPAGKGHELFDHAPERWERLGRLVLAALPAPGKGDREACRARWRRRQRQGKLWSVARLVKAAFTFQGGADYLVWKVERHSGVRMELTPWQRRHPVLAAPVLFWKYRRLGAFR
ncbi:hypothetical protein [Marinimicrococcus flavescens]|uniref:Uncharacterized protein n=1 Tax=Marinimicrococcus flavescens TaxID=3031815 RepID=A0AAP3XPV2_9PROT|nr:hypothetical protein [Marinimicrococcus flavescens]